MNRDDLKELALIRLKDAETLLRNGNYDGVYYLCGYIIECGLKACIAKGTRQYDFPLPPKSIRDIYTHDLERLVGPAGLRPALDQEKNVNRAFERNWALVAQWSEESRYERHSEKEARDLYSAITDKRNGVLRWIKQHW